MNLVELEDWNCCGSSSVDSINSKLGFKLLSRNFALCKPENLLFIPCPSCYSKLKKAYYRLERDENLQKEYRKRWGKDYPKHLYIHWPFCKNRCHYCDFVAFEKHDSYFEPYHKALCEEIRRYVATLHKKDRIITTLFFGGGTPSMYPLDMLKELFEVLHENFRLNLSEATIEVNPSGVTEEHLECWQKCGINRLSVGVQVLDDAILKKLNRHQTKANVQKLMDKAPTYFDNISIDLIMGLPGITKEIWESTLKTAMKWPINHISIYMLMVYEKTKLHFKIKKGEIVLPEESTLVALYKKTCDFLKKHNFEQYELSNFARPGCESIHNQAYWDRSSYRGFGVSAASFDGITRYTNLKNLTAYLEAYSPSKKSKKLSYHDIEKITSQQQVTEELMLGLRQSKGLDLHRMVYLLSVDEQTTFLRQLQLLKSHGLIEEEGGKIRLSTDGMMLENEIILSLL